MNRIEYCISDDYIKKTKRAIFTYVFLGLLMIVLGMTGGVFVNSLVGAIFYFLALFFFFLVWTCWKVTKDKGIKTVFVDETGIGHTHKALSSSSIKWEEISEIRLNKWMHRYELVDKEGIMRTSLDQGLTGLDDLVAEIKSKVGVQFFCNR